MGSESNYPTPKDKGCCIYTIFLRKIPPSPFLFFARIGMAEDQVYFRYKDYRDDQSKVMKLHYDEFIRRFFMHVLPNGFMRIRHYGLLANRCRKASLERIRNILAQPAKAKEKPKADEAGDYPCPKCHQGHLIPIRLLNPLWPQPIIAPG